MDHPCKIVIREHLPPHWIIIFEGMEITCLPDGSTLISGSLPDQSALYGLLMRLRDLGLTLISVNFLGHQEDA